MGSGAETENLPGFVVLMSSGKGGQMQPIAARQWSAGILPSRFQGVKFNSIGDPVLYISNPRGYRAQRHRRRSIEAINALNRHSTQATGGSGDSDAHRAVRDGVSDAGERARPGGHVARSRRACWTCTARSRATDRLRRIVCSRGAWPSAACGSFSFITAIGTITAA